MRDVMKLYFETNGCTMNQGDGELMMGLAAQKNELLCKILAHNIVVLIHEMHELGIKPDFCTNSQPPAQKVSEN